MYYGLHFQFLRAHYHSFLVHTLFYCYFDGLCKCVKNPTINTSAWSAQGTKITLLFLLEFFLFTIFFLHPVYTHIDSSPLNFNRFAQTDLLWDDVVLIFYISNYIIWKPRVLGNQLITDSLIVTLELLQVTVHCDVRNIYNNPADVGKFPRHTPFFAFSLCRRHFVLLIAQTTFYGAFRFIRVQ
jgi:hypothetical protein